MPGTLVSLIIAVAAVLPGFVTVELTQRQRAVRAGAEGQGMVLRALFYALLIHVARLDPHRGMWVAKDSIAELYLLD